MRRGSNEEATACWMSIYANPFEAFVADEDGWGWGKKDG
jgi:hypothetical protein